MQHPHKLFRLQDSLLNKPHLITPAALDSCLSYLENRNTDFEFSVSKSPLTASSTNLNYKAASKVGTLSISGPLSYKATVMTSLCGMTSYEQLQADCQSLVNQGAKTIVLSVDSGGGEASHVFETANLIRSIADSSGVKLISYIDTVGASAAYALACISDEVICNPDSSVGSIGCVVRLRNNNKQLQDAGINDTYLYGGKNKVAFDRNGDWQEGFLEDLQTSIDTLYSNFIGFVATNRSITAQAVANTEARVYSSTDALSIGLVDKIMTCADFDRYVASLTKPVVKPLAVKPVVNSVAVKPVTPKAAPVVESLPKGFMRNRVGNLQAITPCTAALAPTKPAEHRYTKLPIY